MTTIIMTNPVDLRTILDRLNIVDAFIFLSYYETFGKALIEAASQGTPDSIRAEHWCGL